MVSCEGHLFLTIFMFLFLLEGGEDIDGWSVEDLQAVIAEYNHYYGGGEAAP